MDLQNSFQGHFDPQSPVSLYSKMGAHWADQFVKKLSENPCCADFLANETVLKEHLDKDHKFIPNGVDNRFRLQLWLEYENSVKMNRPMVMSNVYNLVGPQSSFHVVVMKDPRRVAWLLCKPIAYDLRMRDILEVGIQRLRGYLDIDAMTSGPKGKPDTKLLKLQLEITRMADLRMNGAPTQKIQEISVKATIGANGELQALSDEVDMATLENRKKELEKRRRSAEGRGTVLDVEIIKDGEDAEGNSIAEDAAGAQ